MSNSETTIWVKAERLALVVTVAAAILVGITTAFDGTGERLSNFFMIVTVVGGVSMGLLYVRRLLSKQAA